MLDKIKIGVKLPLMTVVIGAMALALAELIASRNTTLTVTHAGEERLRAVAESRATEVLRELQSIRADMRAKFRNPVILEAARAFVHSWEHHGSDPSGDLRRLYIDANPNPPDRRYDLVKADDGSPYSLVHRRYHPFFTAHVTGQGYADLFLVSPNGTVVYSTAKQEPFGRNLNTEGLRTLPLAKAFRRVVSGVGFPNDVMTKFTRSPAHPDYDTTVFAVPIISDQGTTEAVLAVRVSAERFTEIMQRPAGLASTGEGFLLGSDRQLVTSLRGAAPAAVRVGGQDAPPVAEVFRKRTGIGVHRDETGVRRVTAFIPLRYMGHQMSVLVQQAESEILAPARVQRMQLIQEGLVVLVLVTLLGLLMARAVSVPLARVGEAMDRVADADYDTDIPDRRRGDEIGTIARQLDAFRGKLVQAEATSRENAFKRAAFEAASAALMLVDRDLTIIYANAQLVDLMERHQTGFDRLARNFSPASLSGRSLAVLFPGAERMRAALANDDRAVEMLRLGDTYLALDMGPVRDGAGRVLGYVLEWRDVSDRHMDRAVLGAVNRVLPIAEFSLDGRLITANHQFAIWIGRGEGSLVGLDWSRLLQDAAGGPPPGGRTPWETVVARLSVDRGAATFPVQRASGGGDVSVFPVSDNEGRLHRFVLIGLERREVRLRHLAALPGAEARKGGQRA